MASAAFPSKSDWFGQPRGLTILFLTEMWEKFSFYGMRALLVYYMIKDLGFSVPKASLVYGIYTAFVYFTPIIGGAVSDRWFGRKRAVMLGGAIMAAGHFLMAFPDLLYLSLAVIAIGNGLFLPNLPSQIDSLFNKGDPRRGSAFNVYYVGVNLGAFLAPLVCGTLGELYGWHYGFGAAGIGMCLGLAVYSLGWKWLPAEPPRTTSQAGARQPVTHLKARLSLLLAVMGAVVIFRGAYEQMGNAIALWADGRIDRVIGSFEIPATWVQSLNPLLVFLLTPLLVASWTRRARVGAEPSPLRKMAIGAIGLTVAFLLLVAASAYSEASGIAPSIAILLLFVFIYTLAELFILPIGLGLFSRLAQDGYRATVIAAWFFAAFLGNLLAGYLGTFWGRWSEIEFFAIMAFAPAIAAVTLLLLDRPARRIEARLAEDNVETGPSDQIGGLAPASPLAR